VPTNDVELIKSIRAMLLNDDGDVPMVQLQRTNPVVKANVNISSSKSNAGAKDDAEIEEKAVEGLTCDCGDSSSSEDESSEDESRDDDRSSMLVRDKASPTTNNATDSSMNNEFDKDVKDTSNDVEVVFEKPVFSIDRQRSRSDSESSSSSSGSSSSSSSSSSDGSSSSSSSSS